MINNEDKEKIDKLFLELVEPEDDWKCSKRIRSLIKSAPDLVYDEWDEEEIGLEAITTLYECFLNSSVPLEKEWHFIGSAFNRTKKRMLIRLVTQSRRKQIQGKSYFLPAFKKDFEDYLDSYNQFFIGDEYYHSFICRFFNINKDNIATSEQQKGFIEEGNAYFYNRNYDKAYKMIAATNTRIRNKTLTLIKKTYDTDNLEIAEIKYNIDLISSILSAKHIAKEFNKHKNEPILFNLFYDHVSAKSRQSINNKYYSIYSTLELKAALNNELNRLQDKLKDLEIKGE